MTPVKSILDPSFQYVNSANTDLRKTFARVRRQHRADTARQAVSRSRVTFIAERKSAA